MRINADGSIAWGGPKVFDTQQNDDQAFAVEETEDHQYIIVCGSSRNNHQYFNSQFTASIDAWVLKLKISDGSVATGWTTTWNPGTSVTADGLFYGGTGVDAAYDIKEDNGDYIVVGKASKDNGDVPSGTTQTPPYGDIWLFKIDGSTGVIDNVSNVVYHNTNSTNPDYATSVTIDCNTGHYIVSGFCGSCETNEDVAEGILFDLPNNFSTYGTPTIYGGNPRDNGFANIIQLHEGIYGTCTTGDGFLALGVQHPNSTGCFDESHDFWMAKVLDDLTEDVDIIAGGTLCVNADIGVAHGGEFNDNGQCGVQTCNGYLLVGFTTSNEMDTDQGTFCSGNYYGCDVSCNHYDCDEDPQPSDIWLLMINPDGTYAWDESIGSGYGVIDWKIPDDKAYSIKRTPDGSYIIAGKRFDVVHGDDEFYIAKFELTAACASPTGLNAVHTSTYCESLSWDMDPCVPRYKVQYRKVTGGAWTTADYATSPVEARNLTSIGSNSFEWHVTAYCSPNNTTTTTGSTFSILHCALPKTLKDCYDCSLKIGSKDSTDYANLLTVYPNPSSGSFQILLQLPYEYDGFCTVEVLEQAAKSIFSTKVPIENGIVDRQISFTNLPSGFYWIRLTINGRSYQSKLVIQ